jgi:bifunctional non-homologous end joining protein LigD
MSAAALPHRGRAGVLPATLRPMLASAADGPLDSSAHAYEIKWDGMRVLAGVEGGRISLRSRNGIEAAPRFPELADLGERVAGGCAVLDGELVTLRDSRPNFWTLQQRIQASRPERIRELADTTPAAFIVFDLLRAGDEWLLTEPWTARRHRLEQLLEPGDTVQLSPVWTDGRALWSTAVDLGLEGIMAKHRAGRYHPGARTRDWLKIKVHDTVDAVVCGWTEGAGERRGSLGALVLGQFEAGRLVYIGHVGSGFNLPGLHEALELLRPLETTSSPFNPPPVVNGRAHWLRPELVCEVRRQGVSAEGRLRSPVFVRWRPDKPAGECGT